MDRKTRENRDAWLQVRIAPTEQAELRARAARENTTVSALVRQGLGLTTNAPTTAPACAGELPR